ncbi:uncharacterized protein LOC126565948 [Anopheles maculipalpis]|uniref:uncharacterized protein LOC126565948 n=1 Tax=Anopheles maculipalpis TaxID=1496333 RepID=UPI0021598F9B|nr:uncharacterized protein LOC126565948 [Anopheles maculipalpis]
MSQSHIARIMHDALHRGVQRDNDELLQLRQQPEFFSAENKTYAVNLLAYALGHLPATCATSFEQWKHSDQLVTDRKLHKSLAALVDRMPTLEFQLIPLVLIQRDQINASFLLRIRKTPGAFDSFMYLDLTGRKYDQFGQFLTANKLPECTLWYPADGQLQYARNPTDDSRLAPSLVIECRKITRTSDVWQELTMVGGAVASLFAFTPVGASLAIPLTFMGSMFSLTDLVDSCKHDPASGIARRAFALTLNLTTFASVGLTAACRVEKLSRLLPAEKLLQLERAKNFLSGTLRTVTTGGAILAVIGTVGGWQTLSNGEWMEMAALLCFAYRENFNKTIAIRLFEKMQWNGVFNFFKNLCANVPIGVLRTQLKQPWFDGMLKFVVDFLSNGIQFTVDDSFTTITVFGYQLQFDTLFKINWSQLRTLLVFLQSFTTNIGAAADSVKQKRWTQTHVDDVQKLLLLVGQLGDVCCKMLADYITLGHGHRFTLGTVRTFLTADKLNKTKLLRTLASLNSTATDALNEMRESGHIKGGDPKLLQWLAQHKASSYGTALGALLAVGAKTPAEKLKSCPITFDDEQRIVVSPLLAFSAQDFLAVPESRRDILLGDERFLRLCYDADKQLLLPRATRVWLHTCGSDTDAIHYLETVGLLKQLFERAGGPVSLAVALDYALDFEATPVVPQVYYSILSSWAQLIVAQSAPLSKRTMQSRFVQLMADAKSLGMARYISAPVPEKLDVHDNDSMIRLAREMIQKQAVVAGDTDCMIPFGPIERAACWLGLSPAMRGLAVRQRFLQLAVVVVTEGSGRALELPAENVQSTQTVNMRRLMFSNNGYKVIVEVKIPGDDNVYVSFYLVSNTIIKSE